MPPGGPASSEPSVEEVFIQRWREMAAAWGINRGMAEIQGLLYITGETLSTDDIMARLGISRGNASMSLRALVQWGIVRKIHQRGDRRDYYESLADVWEIFSLVAQQRMRKEVEPILATLRDCQQRLSEQPLADGEEAKRQQVVHARLEGMLSFLSTMEFLAQRFTGSDHGLARAVDLLGGSNP